MNRMNRQSANVSVSVADVCKRLLLGTFLLSVACWMVACGGLPTPTPGPEPRKELPLPNVPAADREQAVAGNTEFAMSLYKEVKTKEGNLFFSPYSISAALTMAYAGARGETAKEMRKVLAFALDDGKLHPANAWLSIELNNRGVKGPFQLSVVNRLWGQKSYPFSKPFTQLLSDHYRAKLVGLGFSDDPEAARETINQWVEQQTANRIKDLLPKDSIKKSTRLVLTNAIYFKAPWSTKFEKSETKKAPFFLNSDQKVDVDTMHSTKLEGSHADLETHTMVSLPYKEAGVSMLFLIPKKKDGLKALEASLSKKALNNWMQKSQFSKFTSFSMPKFKVEQQLKLVPALKSMGMELPFTDKADFSGIADAAEGLKITDVIHKAFVTVDEDGTEAAAATAVVFGPTSVPPSVDVKIDRPFLFVIRDQQHGNILFMGRITNPS